MFLSCGDALFDLFAGSANADGGESASSTAISLKGDAGGSPMNVACGLSRLGHGSHYLTKMSNDLFGQRILSYLEASGVQQDLCVPTDANSTLAIVETNSDGSARYVFYIEGTADVSLSVEDLPAELPDSIEVIHFGSYSTAVEPVASALKVLATRESAQRFISYDPNLRPSIEPDMARWRDSFDHFSRCASLIKASDEDIGMLIGHQKDAEERFVERCFNAGAELVFITRGAEGASGFSSPGDSVTIASAVVDVVDTVGAGDTFQSTVLHWLAEHGHIQSGCLKGEVDLQGCLNLAAKAAAITCSRAGADLPYSHELKN